MVKPQQPDAGNPYDNGEKYNNPLYMPFLRGATNQRTQTTYGPQSRPNLGQPFVGKNTPTYQQFVGYYGEPKPTYGPTRVVMPYQYYNYP